MGGNVNDAPALIKKFKIYNTLYDQTKISWQINKKTSEKNDLVTKNRLLTKKDIKKLLKIEENLNKTVDNIKKF